MMSLTHLSQISGLKRKDIAFYISNNYPLFRIGKDKITLHMALIITKQMRDK